MMEVCDDATVVTGRQNLVSEVKRYRDLGFLIGTTNGCFDVLHVGHIQSLYMAYQTCSIGRKAAIFVGLNSNPSVRMLKGLNRPINDQKDRALVLASVRWVNGVYIFNESDPRDFLDAVKPDIHFKGSEYKDKPLIERDIVERNGGRIHFMDMVEGYSTTNVLKSLGIETTK